MIELEENVYWDNSKPYHLQTESARTYISNLVESNEKIVIDLETDGTNSRDIKTSWTNGIITYIEITEYLYNISSNAYMSIKGIKNLVE